MPLKNLSAQPVRPRPQRPVAALPTPAHARTSYTLQAALRSVCPAARESGPVWTPSAPTKHACCTTSPLTHHHPIQPATGVAGITTSAHSQVRMHAWHACRFFTVHLSARRAAARIRQAAVVATLLRPTTHSVCSMPCCVRFCNHSAISACSAGGCIWQLSVLMQVRLLCWGVLAASSRAAKRWHMLFMHCHQGGING
jgi:hypothetical protein